MSLTKATFRMIRGADINVLDYGATGDGVTDDTAALQAAINASAASDVCIYVPAGTYKITSELTIVNDCRGITGDGASNTKFNFSGSVGLRIGSGNPISGHKHYERFAVVGTGSTAGTAIFMEGSSHFYEFRDIVLQDALYGIYASNEPLYTGWFVNLRAHQCGTGFYMFGDTPPRVINYQTWLQCTATQCTTSGFEFAAGSNGGFAMQLIAPHCENCGDGIKATNIKNGTITGGYFENNTRDFNFNSSDFDIQGPNLKSSVRLLDCHTNFQAHMMAQSLLDVEGSGTLDVSGQETLYRLFTNGQISDATRLISTGTNILSKPQSWLVDYAERNAGGEPKTISFPSTSDSVIEGKNFLFKLALTGSVGSGYSVHIPFSRPNIYNSIQDGAELFIVIRARGVGTFNINDALSGSGDIDQFQTISLSTAFKTFVTQINKKSSSVNGISLINPNSNANGDYIEVDYVAYSFGLPCDSQGNISYTTAYMSAAPTNGTWIAGDIIYNTAPTAGTATDMGFVCVTGGTPGTWKGFGDIAS